MSKASRRQDSQTSVTWADRPSGGEAPQGGVHMQYAAHLPSSRTLVAPVLALALGAAAATGIYALSDGSDIQLQPEHVVVVEKPSASGATSTNEAATAAAIGNGARASSFGKDEAVTAAAIGKGSQASSSGEDEAAAIGQQTFGARP